jgi:hypothetical protein
MLMRETIGFIIDLDEIVMLAFRLGRLGTTVMIQGRGGGGRW